MIPILYRGDEDLFTSNGLGRLPDCVSCLVTEERNGIYECVFQYPVTGEMYDKIKPGRIIACTHDNGHDIQPFDIYAFTAPINGVVTFYARHISYRLSNVILQPFIANSCADALQKMQTRTYNPNPFTFWTDKDVDGAWENKIPVSCKSLLVGQSGSILDVYGKGEYLFDRFNVRLYVNRGRNTGIAIRYAVNLSDLTQEINLGDTYTAVAPYWRSADGKELVTVPEGYIKSSQIPVHLVPWTTNTGEFVRDNHGEIIYFNVEEIKPIPLDLTAEFQDKPTVEQLRALALSRLNSSEAWLPKNNIRVSFVDQSDTFDAADIAKLQPIKLCDRVDVYCGPLGVSATNIQCVKLVYDVLNERNDNLELGTATPTYAQTLKNTILANYTTKEEASNITNAAIDNATQLITGATNSYVKFVYDDNGGLAEILIMDTKDVETARKIWRWNNGGLGYSNNGYNGPYILAMTQDGVIVADFVKAGTISDAEGNNYWNLVTGVINTQVGQIGAFTIDNGALIYNKNDVTSQIAYTGVSFQRAFPDVTAVTRIEPTGVRMRYLEKGKQWFIGTIEKDSDNSQLAIGYVDGLNIIKFLSIYAENGSYAFEWIELDKGLIANKNILLVDQYNSNNNRAYIQCTNHNFLFGFQNVGSIINMWDTASPHVVIAWDTRIAEDFEVQGNQVVRGTKSRVCNTADYGERLLYAYETPTPYFGDIGEGVISETGDCYIWLDAVFAETIKTDQYQVFLQAYGDGKCYIKERAAAYFVVAGTPGLAFGWEAKAKQGDYDQLRLDNPETKQKPTNGNYAKMAANHIETLNRIRRNIKDE